MAAPIPANEKQRLKVLWQYEVLDTVPEEVFDDLTELAARICEAPIAMITLVDEKRQWFKSKGGVTISETSRDISFCAHAIGQPDLFIVSDETKDEGFAQNPFVITEHKVRFYAGAPLVTPDGHALGTLCVIDKVARELRPDQKTALRVLARHVMTQLELRRHSTKLSKEKKQRERLQNDFDKLRADLAEARRQLRQRKTGSPVNSGRKTKKSRKR